MNGIQIPFTSNSICIFKFNFSQVCMPYNGLHPFPNEFFVLVLPKTIDWVVSSLFSTKFTKLVKHQTIEGGSNQFTSRTNPSILLKILKRVTRRGRMKKLYLRRFCSGHFNPLQNSFFYYGFGQWLLLGPDVKT